MSLVFRCHRSSMNYSKLDVNICLTVQQKSVFFSMKYFSQNFFPLSQEKIIIFLLCCKRTLNIYNSRQQKIIFTILFLRNLAIRVRNYSNCFDDVTI